MPVIADRYELLSAIGRGGMASVHRARDQVLGREVAVKVLRSDVALDATSRERFLREARLAAGLNHQRIVRVYDAGIDDSQDAPWIAMELIEGPSLAERLGRAGPLDPDEAVRLIDAILDGLAAAHAAGVIHRDLKPANILLAPDGPKLTDFGIAKSLVSAAADLTQANQFMGTPKYAAPEVTAGHPATPAADLYSVGVIAYEVLAGRPPFEHPNPLTLAMLHQTDPVPPLADRRPGLPPTLVAAVESALAKDPHRRPGSAEALRRLLVDGGATAGPAPAPAPTAPPPPPHEATRVLPLPHQPVAGSRPPGPPPAGRPSPPRRRSGGVLGVVLLVVVLLAVAAVAFALVQGEGRPGESPSATPGPTVAPTTTPPVTEETPAPPAEPPPPAPPAEPPPPAAPATTPPATDPPAVPTVPVPAPTPTLGPEPPPPPVVPTGRPTE